MGLRWKQRHPDTSVSWGVSKNNNCAAVFIKPTSVHTLPNYATHRLSAMWCKALKLAVSLLIWVGENRSLPVLLSRNCKKKSLEGEELMRHVRHSLIGLLRLHISSCRSRYM